MFEGKISGSVLVFSSFIGIFPRCQLIVTNPPKTKDRCVLGVVGRLRLRGIIVCGKTVSRSRGVRLLGSDQYCLRLSGCRKFNVTTVRTLTTKSRIVRDKGKKLGSTLKMCKCGISVRSGRRILGALLGVYRRRVSIRFAGGKVGCITSGFDCGGELSSFQGVVNRCRTGSWSVFGGSFLW